MKKFVCALAVAVLIFILSFALVGCAESKADESVNCAHEWLDVVSDYNRPATYEASGRQLRECKKCGETVGFVLPMLRHTSGTEASDYRPLLKSYVAHYGDKLEDIQAKYFTTGWAFKSEEEYVGMPTEEGRVFDVRFTSSQEGYAPVDAKITLIVHKGILTADDLLIETAPKILVTDVSLADVSIVVKPSSKIKGTVEWAPGQTIARAQSADYTFIFTPTDSELYEPYTGTLTLSAD